MFSSQILTNKQEFIKDMTICSYLKCGSSLVTIPISTSEDLKSAERMDDKHVTATYVKIQIGPLFKETP